MWKHAEANGAEVHAFWLFRHCNSPEKDVRAPLVAGLQDTGAFCCSMLDSDWRLERQIVEVSAAQ